MRDYRPIVKVDRALFDRTPPHDAAAEASVIGAMVLSGGKAIPEVQRVLRAEDFYLEINKRLYEVVLRGHDRYRGTVDLKLLLTALDPEERATLRQYFDDTPGPATIPYFVRSIKDASFRRKAIEVLGEQIWRIQQNDPEDDVPALIAEGYTKLARQEEATQKISLASAAQSLYDRLESGGDQTYRVGLPKFDHGIGLPKQGIVVIAGTQAAGKSTLALQMLRSIAIEQCVPSWIFSFEMPPIRLAATWATQVTGRNYHAMLRGYTKLDDYESLMATIEKWGKTNVQIEMGNPTAQEIYNTLAASRKDGVRVALVDYVQNLPASPGAKTQSQTDRVQESMRILQRVARELDMLVICVSQLVLAASRNHERPPTMWDIRDSGAVADVADMLIAIWRPGHGVVANDADYTPDEGLLCVLKNKYGEMANIRTRFLAASMTFREDETAMASMAAA